MPRHVARLVVDYFAYAMRPGASARRGSLSTTSLTPCVWVPQHVAWLVVDYFTYTARLGASAHRAARTSRGSSRRSSSTTSTTPHVQVPQHVVRLITRLVAPLVVNYFDYAARPGASARRVARQAARRAAHRWFLRLRR
jgi:hypothetical protein